MTTWLLAALCLAAAQPRTIAGQTFRAAVGPDGDLWSLRVGAAEALAPLAGGAALADDWPVPLALTGDSQTFLTYVGVDANVTYRFVPNAARVTILNAAQRPRHYDVALADGWHLDQALATSAWGARLWLRTTADRTVAAGRWRVACPPLGVTHLDLVADPGPGGRAPADGLWAEPRGGLPGRWSLPASPPFTSPDGAFLNLPLLLANDTDQQRDAQVRLELRSAGGQSWRQEAACHLPARSVTDFDGRLAAPPPGVYTVVVRLGEHAEQRFTLAWASERWPRAAAEPAPPPAEPLAADQIDGQLPTTAAAPAVVWIGWPPEILASPPLGWGWLRLASGPAGAAAARLRGSNPHRRLGVAALGLAPGAPDDIAALACFEPGATPHGPPTRLTAWVASADSPPQSYAIGSAGEECWVYTIDRAAARTHFLATAPGWLGRRLTATSAAP
jgi:hypothetical protein